MTKKAFVSSAAQVFAWLTLAYFLSYFFRATNAAIASDLRQELRLSSGDLGLMTGFFYAAFAFAQIPIGLALDRFGPRGVQPVLLLVAALGAVVFALAQSLLVLTLGRALLGVGLGASLMAAFKGFGLWFAQQQSTSVVGAHMALGGLGAMLAGYPMAWLNDTWGWRNIFWVGALATALVGFGIWVFVRNTPDQTVWPKPQTNGHPLEVLKDPQVLRIACLNFFVAGSLLSVQTLWAGPFLRDVYGLDATSTGAYLTLLSLGVVLGYAVVGWAGDRFGIFPSAICGNLVFVVVLLLLALRPPLAWIGVLYFAFGFFGTGNMLLLSHVRAIFPASMTGRVTTSVNMFGIGGAFVLQSGIGVLVARMTVGTTVNPLAYSLAFAGLGLATLVFLLAYRAIFAAKTSLSPNTMR